MIWACVAFHIYLTTATTDDLRQNRQHRRAVILGTTFRTTRKQFKLNKDPAIWQRRNPFFAATSRYDPKNIRESEPASSRVAAAAAAETLCLSPSQTGVHSQSVSRSCSNVKNETVRHNSLSRPHTEREQN